MIAIEVAGLVSLVLSLVSVPLLLLILIPHTLPRRLTGIAPSQRLTASNYSLLTLTLLFAGQSVLDTISHNDGTGSTVCAVDALLETYFKTAILAHVTVLAMVNSTSIPTPSRPEGASLPSSRQAVLLILAYTYALFPLIPTLHTAALIDFQLTEGFGKWWGIYCIDRASWQRFVRPLTLIPPLVLTIILCFIAFSHMYAASGHPSTKIRPTRRRWLLTVYLLFFALAGVSYLIVEQLIGWVWDWWPRTFESLLCLIIFTPYACNQPVWRPYRYWIRLKRCPPAPIEPTMPLFSMIGSPKRLHSHHSDANKPIDSHLSTSSSFCAMPAPIPELHKPGFYVLDTIPEGDVDSPRREPPGRNAPGLQVRIGNDDAASRRTDASRPYTPPFVYSVAGTMTTVQTTPEQTETLSSPAKAYQQSVAPSSYYSSTTRSTPAGRQIPPPLRIIGPSPIATMVTDDMSIYSRSSAGSNPGSGVTSVFATRHSKGSSLPQFTPSLKVDLHARDSMGGEVVFAGARVVGAPSGGSLIAPENRLSIEPVHGRSPPGTPGTMETTGTAETSETAGTFGRRLISRGGKI